MFLWGLSQWFRSTTLRFLPPVGCSGSSSLQVPVIVSVVWRRWSSALIAASSLSSCPVALARRFFRHRWLAIFCRIEEKREHLSFFGFQRCHDSFGSAQQFQGALYVFHSVRL